MTDRLLCMHIRSLHRWDLTPAEAVALQRELASSIVQERTIDPAAVRFIGGVDVSSAKFSPILTAGIIVWDRKTGDVIDAASAQTTATFPYVPGLLSFREIPALALALRKLRTTPDVIMADGQGRAHPRRLGIASHLGLLVDVPTIGVAKSILCGDGPDPAPEAGSVSPLTHQGEEIGCMVRLRERAKPVYVSPGNRMILDDAVALVLGAASGYRLPEPTRLAHQYVNAVRVSFRHQEYG